MRHEDGGHGAGSIFLAFVLGGVVGAGVALLFAPQSGSETRRRIRELAEDAKERAEGYAGDVRDKVVSSVERGKQFVEDRKTLLSSAVEAGKEAYSREKKRIEGEQTS